MKRRQFSASLVAASLGLSWLQAARAQGGLTEGKEFSKVASPVPVNLPAGKIEVVEFFSFACPHCNEFEPSLEAWVKTLPADVMFHRVPVPFLYNAANFQALYYSLEVLNLVDKMQSKVFAAVHVERLRLEKPDDIAALMAKNGVPADKFLPVFNSFSVQAKVQQAKNLARAYDVNEVPLLAVQGRYLTSPGRAGGPAQALHVADALIQMTRK